jgi:hypothetical protein
MMIRKDNVLHRVLKRYSERGGTMKMTEDLKDIGTHAGLVWQDLKRKGAMSIAALKKSNNLSEVEVQRAIGWLARESKIYFEKKGKTILIDLL